MRWVGLLPVGSTGHGLLLLPTSASGSESLEVPKVARDIEPPSTELLVARPPGYDIDNPILDSYSKRHGQSACTLNALDRSLALTCNSTHRWAISSYCACSRPSCCYYDKNGRAHCNWSPSSDSSPNLEALDTSVELSSLSGRSIDTAVASGPENPTTEATLENARGCEYAGNYACVNRRTESYLVVADHTCRCVLSPVCGLGCCELGTQKDTAYCDCTAPGSVSVDTVSNPSELSARSPDTSTASQASDSKPQEQIDAQDPNIKFECDRPGSYSCNNGYLMICASDEYLHKHEYCGEPIACCKAGPLGTARCICKSGEDDLPQSPEETIIARNVLP